MRNLLKMIGLIVAFYVTTALPCTWCKARGKELGLDKPAPTTNQPKGLGAVAIKGKVAPVKSSLSDNFFKANSNPEREVTQPETISVGDDGTIRKIFR